MMIVNVSPIRPLDAVGRGGESVQSSTFSERDKLYLSPHPTKIVNPIFETLANSANVESVVDWADVVARVHVANKGCLAEIQS
jgi:hypothetical protein